MKDPFPFGPGFLADAVRPLADALGLETLPNHIHEVILSTLFFHVIHVYISPWLSTRLFPNSYPKLPYKSRLNWDVHTVSLVQSTVIDVLALYIVFYDDEFKSMDWRERVWGYTGGTGLIQAFATGYFTWDLYMCARYVNIFGVGMLAHGMSALCVYAFGYRPFVNYYAPVFILYELSSPFLNVHWYCDKLDMTGSNLQLYNGIILITTFFCSRLIWGTYQSVRVFTDIYHAVQYQKTPAGIKWLESAATNATSGLADVVGLSSKGEVMRYAGNKDVPLWLAALYIISNSTLTLLNVYWFGKMIETIRKRFDKPWGTKEPEVEQISDKKETSPVITAQKPVEVEAESVEVRQRKTRRKA